jgi:hypothetical protein
LGIAVNQSGGPYKESSLTHIREAAFLYGPFMLIHYPAIQLNGIIIAKKEGGALPILLSVQMRVVVRTEGSCLLLEVRFLVVRKAKQIFPTTVFIRTNNKQRIFFNNRLYKNQQRIELAILT